MTLFDEQYGTIDLSEENFVLEKLLVDQKEVDFSTGQILRKELSPKAEKFARQYYLDYSDASCAVLKTSTSFNVDNFPSCREPSNRYNFMFNLKHINDTLHVNNLFLSFNKKLKSGGIFMGCVETYQLRKARLLRKYPRVLNYIYYFFDYIFKRVFPKIILLDKLYFFVTAGRNRAISRTETLGRLNYCGFEILDTLIDENLMYFVARKEFSPDSITEKSYRIFLRLPRKGKNGKQIKVYKLRTMFPYAEYIQNYIHKTNNLKEGGKFQDDFRISLVGRFFRKYFLDEIPMLLNLIKGDLKLVGVRPLSNQYFSLYDSEFQAQRLKHKPGLVPPYYVDMPKTLEEIQASEKKYLDSYEVAPFKTDFIYLLKAFRNILFRRARSK